MAKVISTVSDAIDYINTLYESDATAPTSGDEDFTVWLSLLNVAVNIWEMEEGILWRELFSKLSSASDGSKTTVASTTSYSVPSDFRFPASGFVWLGSGTNKTAYKVIAQENVQTMENDSSRWCYFMMDTSPTLEFNPNLASTIPAGYTISYNYYKNASKLTAGASTFEMSDPLFAVYYALSELRREEGDTTSQQIATQKLEAMKTRNYAPAWLQEDTAFSPHDAGFGI
jgi:hypothetical protein